MITCSVCNVKMEFTGFSRSQRKCGDRAVCIPPPALRRILCLTIFFISGAKIVLTCIKVLHQEPRRRRSLSRMRKMMRNMLPAKRICHTVMG